MSLFSRDFRKALWALVFEYVQKSTRVFDLDNNWEPILADYHKNSLKLDPSEFRMRDYTDSKKLQTLFLDGSEQEILDFLELSLNHKSSPEELAKKVALFFKKKSGPYVLKKRASLYYFISIPSLEGLQKLVEDAEEFLKQGRFFEVDQELLQAAKELRKGQEKRALEKTFKALEKLFCALKGDISLDFSWSIEELCQDFSIDENFEKGLKAFLSLKKEGQQMDHFFFKKNYDEIDARFMQRFCSIAAAYFFEKSVRVKWQKD